MTRLRPPLSSLELFLPGRQIKTTLSILYHHPKAASWCTGPVTCRLECRTTIILTIVKYLDTSITRQPHPFISNAPPRSASSKVELVLSSCPFLPLVDSDICPALRSLPRTICTLRDTAISTFGGLGSYNTCPGVFDTEWEQVSGISFV